MTEEASPTCRLALRCEGLYWVAYYAPADSMTGATEIGRIAIIARHEKHRQVFARLMQDIVSDIIEEREGVRPQWSEPRVAVAKQ